jgi:hypothetical protein
MGSSGFIPKVVERAGLAMVFGALGVVVISSPKTWARAQSGNQNGSNQNSNNSTDDDAAPPAAPKLPADLNKASLRVTALDTLYELDLSIDQLRDLRDRAQGAASTRERESAKSIPKLGGALRSLQNAILAGSDDQTIAKKRNAVADIVTDAEGLDDNIQSTPDAISKALEVSHNLNSGQIAAFLAAHADEVSDPVERMVNAVEEMREGSVADMPGFIQETSDDVARLVAGVEEPKAKNVSDKVAVWLKNSQNEKGELTEAQRVSFEQSARRIVGDTWGIKVLDHWIQGEMAILLSNPELPNAIDMMITVRQHAEKAGSGEPNADNNIEEKR